MPGLRSGSVGPSMVSALTYVVIDAVASCPYGSDPFSSCGGAERMAGVPNLTSQSGSWPSASTAVAAPCVSIDKLVSGRVGRAGALES